VSFNKRTTQADETGQTMEFEKNLLDETLIHEAQTELGPDMEQRTIETKSGVRYVTQSKFFSSAFNAAIFDGPIRIYFAQYQEAQALKLYHNLQERFGDVRKHARGIFKERGRNIFVMLYPNDEIFDVAFADNTEAAVGLGNEDLAMGAGAEAGPHVQPQPVTNPQILQDRLGDDFVLGVCGPMEDEGLNIVCERMESIVHSA
jgi:hypothetical protein